MTFQKLLNDYLTQLGCTARELSAVSGISAPVISRYRSGSQSPDLAQCRKLSAGIAALAAERGRKEITQESVESAFREALTFRKALIKSASVTISTNCWMPFPSAIRSWPGI